MKDRAVNRNRCCVAGQKGSRSGGRDADSSSCAWLSSTTCSVASPPPLNSSVPYSTSFSPPIPQLSHFSLRYFLDFPTSLSPCPGLHPSALAAGFLTLSVPLLLKCHPELPGPGSGLLDAAVIPA